MTKTSIEPILTLARKIFNQKYEELVKIRNELKAGVAANHPDFGHAKLKEYEKLAAEMKKNYKKTDKILKEIKTRLQRNKSKK